MLIIFWNYCFSLIIFVPLLAFERDIHPIGSALSAFGPWFLISVSVFPHPKTLQPNFLLREKHCCRFQGYPLPNNAWLQWWFHSRCHKQRLLGLVPKWIWYGHKLLPNYLLRDTQWDQAFRFESNHHYSHREDVRPLWVLRCNLYVFLGIPKDINWSKRGGIQVHLLVHKWILYGRRGQQ